MTPIRDHPAAAYLKHWKPWPNRASTWRLDLSKVQLSQLETAKGLPDLFPLYVHFISSHLLAVLMTTVADAEGNGDSISAAVQAERIALLTSVLSQSQMSSTSSLPDIGPGYHHLPRSHSLTPPQSRHPFVDISPPKTHAPVHRSQSHFDLGQQYMNSRPIYQTSGHRHPSPPFAAAHRPPPSPLHVHAPAPVPLLPSFLQDIVQSPTLSPASTSSADLSFEEYDDRMPSPIGSTHPRKRSSHASDSVQNLPLSNIWRLDGEETKTLSAFALPNHEDLMGRSRKNSRETVVS